MAASSFQMSPSAGSRAAVGGEGDALSHANNQHPGMLFKAAGEHTGSCLQDHASASDGQDERERIHGETM
jgi:hypothetical protein